MSGVVGIIDGFRARSGGVSFLERLDDVRGRLISSLILVIVTTGIGFYVSAFPLQFEFLRWTVNLDILGIFVAPIEPYLNGEKLKYLSPMDPFFITLRLAFCLGLLLSLPYLLAQVWGLLSPLMRQEEKRLVAPAVFGGVVLFAAGTTFCYAMVLPIMLQFTMGFQQESLEQSIVIGEYLSTVLRLLVAFGLAFELPIVILLLTVLGVVTPTFLISRRRHAIAIMTIVSAVVTPADLGSMILLLIPLLILYEISIVMSRAIFARRVSTAAAAEL